MTTAPAVSTPVSDNRLHSLGLLRLALKLDAAVTGVNGAAYLAAAPLLQDVLGVPAGALRGVGLFLLVFAATVWLLSTRPTVSTGAAGVVVAINLLWAIDSVVVALSGWGTPTTIGAVWIMLQAAVVGGFAALQWTGIRRSNRS